MKAKKHKVSALSPDQLRGVLEIAAAKSPRDHAMLLVQYFHGLRASELVNLKLSDLDRRQRVWAVKVERLKGSLETRQSVWEVRASPCGTNGKCLQTTWRIIGQKMRLRMSSLCQASATVHSAAKPGTESSRRMQKRR